MRQALPCPARWALAALATVLLAACDGGSQQSPDGASPQPADYRKWADPRLDSLTDLSVAALRSRHYGSTLHDERDLAATAAGAAYRAHFFADGVSRYDSRIASYDSDGLRVYARVDIPAGAPPEKGYPVLIFVHGWVGRDAVPDFDFLYRPDSVQARYVDAFAAAGFLVVSPALRGHGTVAGVPAEGVAFLEAWDNASYLSPMFYAIDVLNLLEGLQTLESVDWPGDRSVRIDRSRIHIAGHSQGADAVLTALAVSGEGSTVRNTLASGSLWSGCFAPRLEQLAVYGPMAASLEAFMAGDGSWTGSSRGRDGRINPNFVFGWPPDWIGTTDPSSPDWTWQAETWSSPTVGDVLQTRATEMYAAINSRVGDAGKLEFSLSTGADGSVSLQHDPRLVRAMEAIDAYRHEHWLSEALHLHHSDQDYYALPRWNADLAARINASGGMARAYAYPRNTHSLLASEHAWFSPGEVVAGLPYMIGRDLALFGGADPRAVPRLAEEPLSIAAVRRYAEALHNEFRSVRQRTPIDGVRREVVAFSADGLEQYALVLSPTAPPPRDGWPVLVMLHGHHPNPPEYGRIAGGATDRPGDYYRGLPLAYAREGFLVVVPDFRGHNDSAGAEFAGGLLESYWYTRDAIGAFRAVHSLPHADMGNVFLWGHSMGGAVTLRAMLALGDEVRGASIWSGSVASLWDKARHYADQRSGTGAEAAVYFDALRAEIAALPFAFDPELADPGEFLSELRSPLQMQHAERDATTPYAWSEAMHDGIALYDHPVTLYSYPSEDHLFTGAERAQAIARDVAFFRQLLSTD